MQCGRGEDGTTKQILLFTTRVKMGTVVQTSRRQFIASHYGWYICIYVGTSAQSVNKMALVRSLFIVKLKLLEVCMPIASYHARVLLYCLDSERDSKQSIYINWRCTLKTKVCEIPIADGS